MYPDEKAFSLHQSWIKECFEDKMETWSLESWQCFSGPCLTAPLDKPLCPRCCWCQREWLHYIFMCHCIFQSLKCEGFPPVHFSLTLLINRSHAIWSRSAVLLLPVIWGNNKCVHKNIVLLTGWSPVTVPLWRQAGENLFFFFFLFDFKRIHCTMRKSLLVFTNVCLFIVFSPTSVLPWKPGIHA